MEKTDLKALAAIALLYLAIESLGVTCPILYLTGIACAGCGMSRAWLALLRGNLAEAARFHPLFWLPVPAAALLLFRHRLPRRVFLWAMGAVCALFLGVYLVRLFSPGDDVVVFRPAQGFLVQMLRRLCGGTGQIHTKAPDRSGPKKGDYYEMLEMRS